MTLKFLQHNNECWHVFSAAAVETTSEGVVKVYGAILDMNHEDGPLDGSRGFITFINGVPVWNSNVIGNTECCVSDDLTAEQLREIADFMETVSVSHLELAKLGL